MTLESERQARPSSHEAEPLMRWRRRPAPLLYSAIGVGRPARTYTRHCRPPCALGLPAISPVLHPPSAAYQEANWHTEREVVLGVTEGSEGTGSNKAYRIA